MKPLQPLMDTIVWAGQNYAHNLDFIPDDKLDWKPSPEAKSAIEITGEVVGVIRGTITFFQTGHFPMEPTTFASREEGKAALKDATVQYAEFLGTLGANDLGGEVELPFGIMPKIQVLAYPMVETLHHHGQIAYIQSLLGDKEVHFLGM